MVKDIKKYSAKVIATAVAGELLFGGFRSAMSWTEVHFATREYALFHGNQWQGFVYLNRLPEIALVDELGAMVVKELARLGVTTSYHGWEGGFTFTE